MSLSEKLVDFMKKWPTAKNESFIGHEIVTLLNQDIKTKIEDWSINIHDDLLVQASVGKGRWADVPWVSIRNIDIAPSMSNGIYPVYLFNADGTGFYLSLNQGTENTRKEDVQENIKRIRTLYPELLGWGIEKIDLKTSTGRGKSYEIANISAKYYSSTDVINDKELREDLEYILKLYEKMNFVQSDNGLDLRQKDSITLDENLTMQLNQILYGPPGTGKTYKTVEEAVAICDPDFKYDSREQLKKRYDELIENKQISFVTFHQSFSYEDFVEGIRAKTENGQIEYSVDDGIFKQVSKLASQKILSNVWKLAFVDDQRQNKKIEQECLENNYILLRYSNSLDEDDNTVVDTKYRQDMENSFMDEMQIGDLVLISDGVKNIRAIAEITSETKLLENIDRDTYKIKRDVKWLSKFDKSISNEGIITQKFKHDALYLIDQSILKIDGLQKVIEKNLVLNEAKKNYVLIIDEINRGNIANIFGELITLLEPSKRAGNDDARSVTLPYSKESFSVPNNLYVIGTMNTSDHSLTKLDLALRRRFEFVELLPDYKRLDNINVHGVNIGKMLKIMNDRIEILLGRDYLIGHSYFLELEGLTEDKQQEKLANIFKNKIIPLLQEYFFEDWERIQWVLNDQNKKNDNFKFIKLMKDNNDKDYLTQLFGNLTELNHIPDRRYQINNGENDKSNAFEAPEAYQQIIQIKESE